MNQFKRFFKELFTEAETFQARSKESGKLVNFKSKAAADAAVKAGSHEDPKAPKSGKAGGKDSKKTTPAPNIFDKPKEEPKASTSKADTTDDRWGDRFELGTPAVYNDNGKEYSGEVVMNKSNQQVQINGRWTMIGKGTHKGIQVYGSDTFIIPDNWNDVKGFDDSMEEPKSEPSQPKQPRKGNPEVNKATKSLAEKEGFTPSQLGNQEYKTKMMQAAVSALADANFHQEARELVAKLEGKPEWAKAPQYPSMDDPEFDEKMKAIRTNSSEASKFMQPDGKTWAFGREIAQQSQWDGVDAADGIAFTLRMNGFHKEADAIQSIFDDKPYMKESGPLKLGKLVKESKRIKLKK
jgi:hypothetical protein